MVSQGPITHFNNTSRSLSKPFACANQTEPTIYSYCVQTQLPVSGLNKFVKVHNMIALSTIKREPL